jgi:cytoskeletal protein CcmA (bactofilin family)
VNGAAALKSTLAVTGDTTLSAKLNVAGDSSMNKVVIHGDASLNSTLNVNGAAALKSTLAVTGDTTLSAKLNVAGDASMNKVEIHGDASLNSTLNVNGAAALKSTLFVTGDASLNNKLYVKEDATFDKHIGATDISAGMFQTGRLYLEDQYNNVNHENLISTTSGDITIRAGPDTSGGVVHIKSHLIVDGSFSFMGAITQTDVVVKVSEQLDVSANSASEAFKAEQHQTGSDVATFYNTVTSASVPIFVVGSNFVAVNKASEDANYDLDVSGTIHASGALLVGGAVTFSDNLTVTGNYASTNGNVTLTNGNITLTNGKITTKTLEVTTTSLFTGKVTMNGGLDMAANTFINQIGESEVW